MDHEKKPMIPLNPFIVDTMVLAMTINGTEIGTDIDAVWDFKIKREWKYERGPQVEGSTPASVCATRARDVLRTDRNDMPSQARGLGNNLLGSIIIIIMKLTF